MGERWARLYRRNVAEIRPCGREIQSVRLNGGPVDFDNPEINGGRSGKLELKILE
jgi:hypothetical protein